MVSAYKEYIHIVPMKNRTKQEQIRAYQDIATHHSNCNHKPTYQRLDNETSNDLEAWFHKQKLEFQYCDKDNHRRNLAERAIRDAKNHIIATLATAHPDCPKTLWDEALPQVNITLNLLRRWHTNTTKSAYEGFHNKLYDFDAHHIAPFGKKS